MILDDKEYDKVWNRVYKELGFTPNIDLNVKPFTINKPYVIYDISKITEECYYDNDNDIITNAFINCTEQGELLYALDWQHEGFKVDPRNNEEIIRDKSIERFPDYYPDGDYSFFIDCDFKFGYLAHPWHRKIWIFGTKLIKEFNKISDKLGWIKVF